MGSGRLFGLRIPALVVLAIAALIK